MSTHPIKPCSTCWGIGEGCICPECTMCGAKNNLNCVAYHGMSSPGPAQLTQKAAIMVLCSHGHMADMTVYADLMQAERLKLRCETLQVPVMCYVTADGSPAGKILIWEGAYVYVDRHSPLGDAVSCYDLTELYDLVREMNAGYVIMFLSEDPELVAPETHAYDVTIRRNEFLVHTFRVKAAVSEEDAVQQAETLRHEYNWSANRTGDQFDAEEEVTNVVKAVPQLR